MQHYKTIVFSEITCYKCHIVFCVTNDHKERLINTGDEFCCPSGHNQSYSEDKDKKRIKKLEKELSDTHTRKNFWMDQANASERSKSAMRGHLTRKKNQLEKVKKGVCPCCDRFFENLHRHIKNQHPEFIPLEDN